MKKRKTSLFNWSVKMADRDFKTVMASIRKNKALSEGYSELEYEQSLTWEALKKDHNPNYDAIFNEIQRMRDTQNS